MRTPAHFLVIVLSLGALAACDKPHLGLCNEREATELVFTRDGYPAYVGQALVQESCTPCHTAQNTGSRRRGAPVSLDYDVVGSQTADPRMPDEDALAHVQAARQLIWETRFDIFDALQTGRMPPGGIGLEARGNSGYADLAGTPLLEVESAEGVERVRGWLACGAPMVERSAAYLDDMGMPIAGRTAGAECSEGDVGDYCVVQGMGINIDPVWSQIYDFVIEPGCVLCHSNRDPTRLHQSQLDLSTADIAYAALVGVRAMGDHNSTPCSETGATRVVAGDPDASLLVQKLEGVVADGSPVCGDRMIASPAAIAKIRLWIAMGAMDD